MKLSYLETKKGWWIETRAIVPCKLPKDGLIAVFNYNDVAHVLDLHYPVRKINGQKVWYFNDTFDRECAEQEGDEVSANPQVLLRHFMGTS